MGLEPNILILDVFIYLTIMWVGTPEFLGGLWVAKIKSLLPANGLTVSNSHIRVTRVLCMLLIF